MTKIKVNQSMADRQIDRGIERGLQWARVGCSIGWVSFKEIVRDKILYNVALCAFLLFFLSFLASRLNFLRPERIILDFGLLTINLSCSLISILMGSGLLPKEFEQRTAYVALARPISRFHFVLGKFIGLIMVLGLNWLLQSFSYLILLALITGGFESEILARAFSWTLISALLLLLVQSWVLASLAILFSTLSTQSLSVISTLGLFLIGNLISQLRLFIDRFQLGIARVLARGMIAFLPNLEHFNLGNKVTYGLPVSWSYLSLSIFYGFFMIALYLGFAGILIQRREI